MYVHNGEMMNSIPSMNFLIIVAKTYNAIWIREKTNAQATYLIFKETKDKIKTYAELFSPPETKFGTQICSITL